MQNPLFNPSFLKKRLAEYKAEVKDNSSIFLKWHNDNQKEEALQTNFLNDIFGKVLGYAIDTGEVEFAMNGGLREQQRFKMNFQEFIEGCVLINAQQGVPYTVSDLKTSTNLWSLISNKDGLSPIFTFKYVYDNNTSDFLSCKDGVDNISEDMNAQMELTESSIANKIFPNYSDSLDKYLTTHKTALDYLTTASKTASDNLTQAIMVNEIQQTVSNMSDKITPYEQARVSIQQQNAYRIIGANANSWITNTKTLFEAIMYAIFPIVVLFVISPIGGIKILINYIMVFAWLTLWGPCFAVINMIANYSDKLQTGEVFGSGLTIGNHLDVITVQEQISSMAGYFSILVPFITLFVFQGLGAMSSLAHKLGGTMEGVANQVAGESSTGNISVGNTSFNNVGANKQDMSSFFKGQGHSATVSNDGLITRETASGIKSYDAMSEMSSKLNTSFGLNESEVSSLSNSVAEIESQSTNKAISNAVSNGFSVSSSDGYSRSHMDNITDSMSYTKNMSEDLSKSTGLSQQQVLDASAKIKGGMSIAGFGAEFGGGISKSMTSSDAYKQLQSFAESEKFDTAFSYMQKNSMDESISYTDSHGNTKTSTVDEALRTAQDYSRQISNSNQLSSIQNTGKTDDYAEFVANHYGKDAEGIFNHRDHNYDSLRTDSLQKYSEYSGMQNNSFNNQNHMREMEARAFMNEHYNGMNNNNHRGGYSNADTKSDVESMIGYTSDNIQNEKNRFTNTIETEGKTIASKANDNVFHGSYDAVKESLKDLIKKKDEE